MYALSMFNVIFVVFVILIIKLVHLVNCFLIDWSAARVEHCAPHAVWSEAETFPWMSARSIILWLVNPTLLYEFLIVYWFSDQL